MPMQIGGGPRAAYYIPEIYQHTTAENSTIITHNTSDYRCAILFISSYEERAPSGSTSHVYYSCGPIMLSPQSSSLTNPFIYYANVPSTASRTAPGVINMNGVSFTITNSTFTIKISGVGSGYSKGLYASYLYIYWSKKKDSIGILPILSFSELRSY